MKRLEKDTLCVTSADVVSKKDTSRGCCVVERVTPCVKDKLLKDILSTVRSGRVAASLYFFQKKKMGRTIHTLILKREPGQKWGFGISGGKDCALTFRIEKVSLASPAGTAGLKNLDYLVKVNGTEVFDMGHSQLVQMIKNVGTDLEVEIER